MSDNSIVYIVVAIGVAIVVALALWFGRGLEIGKWYVRVKQPEGKKSTTVSVGEKLELTGSKVRDIAGVKQSGAAVSDVSNQNVDVLRGGKIKNTDIAGDITGVKQDGGDKT